MRIISPLAALSTAFCISFIGASFVPSALALPLSLLTYKALPLAAIVLPDTLSADMFVFSVTAFFALCISLPTCASATKPVARNNAANSTLILNLFVFILTYF